MLKSNEIRIGNYVKDGYTDHPVKVTHRDIAYTDLVDKNVFEGVPLTPEILEKCGFEKIKHITEGVIYKKDWLKCNERMTGFEWRGGYIYNAPKHLHQLQNLYFSLTGEELTVNL